MTRKKRERAPSKPSKTTYPRAEGSREKLAEDFIADLYCSWEQHGREILDYLRTKRPRAYFRALVELTIVLHRALDKPRDFDRRRSREEALQRLEAAQE
jgi:hypothetical protein